MTRLRQRSADAWRHACLAVATLAIALKVLIPGGFMAAPPTNDLPFALVLCTGQGAMVVEPGQRLPHQDGPASDNGGADASSPCVFAGHAAVAEPPILTDLGRVSLVAYAYRPNAIASDLAPGRGLAGPPLPARGPPSPLI